MDETHIQVQTHCLVVGFQVQYPIQALRLFSVVMAGSFGTSINFFKLGVLRELFSLCCTTLAVAGWMFALAADTEMAVSIRLRLIAIVRSIFIFVSF